MKNLLLIIAVLISFQVGAQVPTLFYCCNSTEIETCNTFQYTVNYNYSNCAFDTGTATINLLGGTAPYNITWSNNQTGNTITAQAGTYSFTAVDAEGCEGTGMVNIQEGALLQVSGSVINEQCTNGEGSIQLSHNGIAPFTYTWSNGLSGNNPTGLSAGTYIVTVSDTNGCTDSESFTVLDNCNCNVSASIQGNNPSCITATDGSINVTPSGGTTYTYTINGNIASPPFTGLGNGSYNIVVTSGQCTYSQTITLNNQDSCPCNLAITCETIDDDITTTVTNATGNVNYIWSNGATTSNLTNVPNGTYSVTVTDDNCSATATCTVNTCTPQSIVTLPSANSAYAICTDFFGFQFVDIRVPLSPTIPINCNQCCTGITYQLGVTSYLNGTLFNTQAPILVECGTEILLIAEAFECGTLNVGDQIEIIWTRDNLMNSPTCSVGGLIGGTTQSYIHTVTPSDLSCCLLCTPGTACNDGDPCTFDEVWNSNCTVCDGGIPVSINSSCSTTPDNGTSNGSATVVASSNTTINGYFWSTGQTGTTSITGLSAGTYTVTITTSTGCTQIESCVVDGPDPCNVSASWQVGFPSCFGANDALVSHNFTTGGQAPYSYQWNNGMTTPSITVEAGSYSVVVTDALGCNYTQTFTIIDPPELFVSCQATNEINGNDGSVQALPSGGNGTYTYAWSNGGNTQTISNLSQGTYTVTVTDGLGCTKTATCSVGGSSCNAGQTCNDNNPCTINDVILSDCVTCQGTFSNLTANVTCNAESNPNASNGSATVNASGGNPAYTYIWSNGETTSTINNLTSGIYTVTVTDMLGCTTTGSCEVTVGSCPTITGQFTAPTIQCNGDNGTLSITANGGALPYTYLWSTGQSTQSININSGGDYTVTVTDANSCSQSFTINLFYPDPIETGCVTTQTNGTNPTGTINPTITGGLVPYTYIWSNGSTSRNLNNLSAGNYTLTVTDALGCSKVQTCTVQQGPCSNTCPIDDCKAQVIQNADCSCSYVDYADCLAQNTITLQRDTDTNPCTYNELWTYDECNGVWCTQQSISTLVGECCDDGDPLTYNDKYTGPNGTVCECQGTVCPDFTINVNNIDCNNATGSITFNSQWSTSSPTTGLNPGTYTYEFTGLTGCTGCTRQKTFSITGSLPLEATCGTDEVNVTGGKMPYSYAWSDGSNTATIPSCGSSLSVTVTDSDGCIISLDCSRPCNQYSFNAFVNTPISCPGGTGTISAQVGGFICVPPVFQWSNGQTNVATVTAGTYTVTFTDNQAGNCEYVAQVTISDPPVLEINCGTITPPNVQGASTGSIAPNVSGGTAPYTYKWVQAGTFPTLSTASVLTNIPDGSYNLEVTDANGCTANITCVLPDGPCVDPVFTLTTNNQSCDYLDNGSMFLTGPASSNFIYNWSTGATNTTLITGLSEGTYCVTVTNPTDASCQTVKCDEVTAPPVLTATCTSNSSSIIINASGGPSSNYSYRRLSGPGGSIVQSQSTNIFSGLGPGIYYFRIVSGGCSIEITCSIAPPCTINLSSQISDITCPGDLGGFAVFTNPPTSGNTFVVTGPNGFLNAPTSTSTFVLFPNGTLEAGVYYVTAEKNGCFGEITVVLTEPEPLTVNCNNGNSIVTGGTGTISYSWNTGATTSSINTSTPGTYSLTVTDTNGCTNSCSFTTGCTSFPTVSVSQGNPDCSTIDMLYTATATGAGGSGSYSYMWSNNATASSVTLNGDTNYNVTVTDGNGCTGTVNIPENDQCSCPPNSPGFSLTVSNTGTELETIINPAWQIEEYQWSNGSNTSSIPTPNNGGTYSVTVVDVHGCEQVGSITVTGTGCTCPCTGIQSTVDANGNCICDPIPDGDGDGFNECEDCDDNNPNIPGNPGTSCDDGNTATNNDVLQADGCTCEGQPCTPFTINVNTQTNIACYGNTGTICADPNASYSWDSGETTQCIQVNAGTHYVTVTDNNGCEGTGQVTIANPLVACSCSMVVNCQAYSGTDESGDGYVETSVSGGVPGYTYQWSNGETTENISGLVNGNYSVTVTDQLGCTAVCSATVCDAKAPILGVNFTSPNCSDEQGTHNYLIINGVNYLGNEGVYTFFFSGTTTPITFPQSLDPGTYYYDIVDQFGCVTSTTLSLPGPDPLNATCGTTELSISGGTPPYSVLWNSSILGNTIPSSPPNTHQYTVTDAEGCTVSGICDVACPVLNVTSDNVTNETCGENNGSISLTSTGNSYSWSNNASGSSINNLSAGNYTVTITDGCSSITRTFIITNDCPNVEDLFTCNLTSSGLEFCPTGNQCNNASLTIDYGNGEEVMTNNCVNIGENATSKTCLAVVFDLSFSAKTYTDNQKTALLDLIKAAENGTLKSGCNNNYISLHPSGFGEEPSGLFASGHCDVFSDCSNGDCYCPTPMTNDWDKLCEFTNKMRIGFNNCGLGGCTRDCNNSCSTGCASNRNTETNSIEGAIESLESTICADANKKLVYISDGLPHDGGACGENTNSIYSVVPASQYWDSAKGHTEPIVLLCDPNNAPTHPAVVMPQDLTTTFINNALNNSSADIGLCGVALGTCFGQDTWMNELVNGSTTNSTNVLHIPDPATNYNLSDLYNSLFQDRIIKIKATVNGCYEQTLDYQVDPCNPECTRVIRS